MELLDALLGITGGAALASLLTLWLSPHACRWTAALLLVQATSVEAQREERTRAWRRLDETLECCGVAARRMP